MSGQLVKIEWVDIFHQCDSDDEESGITHEGALAFRPVPHETYGVLVSESPEWVTVAGTVLWYEGEPEPRYREVAVFPRAVVKVTLLSEGSV